MKYNIPHTVVCVALAAVAVAITVSIMLYKPHVLSNTQRIQHAPPSTSRVVTASIYTNLGEIRLLLLSEIAPNTVANFIRYATSRRYDNTIFHSIIHNFIIEAGGYNVNLQKIPPFETVKNESNPHFKNKRGTVAMTRLYSPDSARSQFFFNMADNDSLDIPHGYTVFAQVTHGMKLLEFINEQPTRAHKTIDYHMPAKQIVIHCVRINYPDKSQAVS